MKLAMALLAAFAANSALADSECKRGEGSDMAWRDFSERNPHKDLKKLLASNKTEAAADEALGPSVKQRLSNKDATTEKMWVYGASQEGRECNSEGHYESAFMVQYAIIEAVFEANRLKACSVRLRTFIGEEQKPDPFSFSPIHDDVKECSTF